MSLSPEARYHLFRGCRNKAPYKNREKADRAIDKLAALGQLMFYYQCSFCQKFHLTSKEPNEYLNRSIRDEIIRKINEA